MDREKYLMSLLGFEKRNQLIEFLNSPERPTGNMEPPAVREIPDESPHPKRTLSEK
jgi:hypothetical protein